MFVLSDGFHSLGSDVLIIVVCVLNELTISNIQMWVSVCVNFYLFCSVLLSWLCDDKKRWMSLWFSHTVELIQKLAIGRLERPLNFRKNFWALDIFVLVKWSFYFVCCVSVFFMGMFVPSFFWFVFWFCFARNWLNTLLNWNSVG